MHTTNTYILISEACRVLPGTNELLIDILLRAGIKDNGVDEIRPQLTRFLPQSGCQAKPDLTVAGKQLLPPSKRTNSLVGSFLKLAK